MCIRDRDLWDPLHISATAEARNSKFGVEIDREVPYRKNENFRKKGLPGGHVTIFGNHVTPSISRQRLKLEIRNLVCRLIARCPIVRMKILLKMGH